MNLNVIWIGLLRTCLCMCSLALASVIFTYTTHSDLLLMVFAHAFPYSLVFLCALSVFLSGLMTIKYRNWMSTRLDQWMAWCGVAFGLLVLCAMILDTYETIQRQQRIAAREAQALREKPAPIIAPKQWTARSWTGVMPDCLRLKDSEIESSCPGRVSLTYCWRMDKAKEWNAKEADCELDQKKQMIFAMGTTTLKVPWCRSYHETCQAELKPLQAQAIDK